MKRFFLSLSIFLANILLRFRYKITYKGLKEVKALLKDTSHGCLFLPNHPAVLVDPLIVSLPLIKLFKVRPLIVEYMYYQPAFNWAVNLLNALPIPNFGSSVSPLKLKRAERVLATMSEGLKQGDRFLIYPAGTTKLTAKEIIGGAFGVHQLVSQNKNVPIVLVRVTGLWGSAFSRAYTAGGPAHTQKMLKLSPWIALKNFLFFVPKREVVVEFEIADQTFPRSAQKQEFNHYLEDWYNKPFGPDGEPLKLVSYAFWKDEVLEIKKPITEEADLSQVPEDVKKQINEKIAQLAKVPVSQVVPDAKLIEQFGLDSLDLAELLAFLSTKFSITDAAPDKLSTVASLYLLANGPDETEDDDEKPKNERNWAKNRSRVRIDLPEGNSIPEVFLNACNKGLRIKCLRTIAFTDPVAGPMSYFKCKRSVLLLAEHFKKFKGDRVGILMPASGLSYLLVLACQMAGKTPVMINWTVGGKHLDTVVDVSKLQVVVSSWAFLDALPTVDISRIEPLLVILEELKATISFWEVLKASFSALKKTPPPKIDPDSEAVVLFTSGTEGMPKGVPLTHANILFDIRAALKTVTLFEDDRLLAMLPPFHSFGFTVTGLMPLLGRLPVAYYPNPTDSKGLAHAIERWNITILCSAPTFLKNILEASESNDLPSLRMIISGAERAPDELLNKLHQRCPKAYFIEGYGITECAPILCANATGDRKKGVGRSLQGIKIKIVDPETHQMLSQVGATGLIVANGLNIFSGYLNKSLDNPFIEVDDALWYNTGDLGHLDQEGNLLLSGRLKRFIKIGGEMISLGAIEEVLASQTHKDPKEFVVVTQGDAMHKPTLVLIATSQYEVPQVNQMLRQGGLSGLAKIDRVVTVDAIPQTGTGKVAYRELDKLIQETP